MATHSLGRDDARPSCTTSQSRSDIRHLGEDLLSAAELSVVLIDEALGQITIGMSEASYDVCYATLSGAKAMLEQCIDKVEARRSGHDE